MYNCGKNLPNPHLYHQKLALNLKNWKNYLFFGVRHRKPNIEITYNITVVRLIVFFCYKFYPTVWLIQYKMSGKEPGTTDIAASALDLIGNTPLLALDRIWPG